MNITIHPIAVDGATAAKMAGVSLSTWQELVRIGKARGLGWRLRGGWCG